eukprot:TRINITY_DN5377_c0_g1_i1.p1 TRINITY_DN5377_c0_g1~~TRINITY_DN5377_c0_g1_i1.p1  ORF type:complete len:697 (+),score=226.07 TRINITY_DN5377_c0_g1_i1:75-2165(+)
MKTQSMKLLGLVAAQAPLAAAVNPLGKAIELMSDLSLKITKDGETELVTFREYESWCAKEQQSLGFQIDDAAFNLEEAEAVNAAGMSASEVASGKIEELSGRISRNDAQLSEASKVREQETDDFAAQDKELQGSVDVLKRALGILTKQLEKGGAALLQAKVKGHDKSALISTLKQVVEAAAIGSQDAQVLVSLAEKSEDEAYLPKSEIYDMQSRSILEVLQELEDKAEKDLVECRKKEAAAKHSFDLLAASLSEQLKVDKSQLEEQKAAKSEGDRKAAASKDEMAVATKEKAQADKTLKSVSAECTKTDEAHEQSKKNRAEELEAIAAAKKALEDSTGPAAARLYTKGTPSFVQVSSINTPEDLAGVEIQDIVRKIEKSDHSTAMAQLSRVVAKAAMGAGDFSQLTKLIEGIISRLQAESNSDGSHQEYCDTELAKSGKKAAKLELELEKLTSRKDIDSARIASLKRQTEKAREVLTQIAESQTTADKIRQEEKAAYETEKKEVTTGIEGVRVALKVLREFYATRGVSFIQIKEHSFKKNNQKPATPTFHSKAGSETNSITSMLSVVESDMSKSLAKAKVDEEAAIREHDKITEENRLAKDLRNQDVKYTVKAIAELKTDLRQHESDYDASKTESEAVAKYTKEIEEACAFKGPTFEERKAAREMEIANLKEALGVITSKVGKGFFLQKSLRGKKQ